MVCPDLSQNCLGRAHVLAKLASTEFDVEVVGPMYQDEIWSPLQGEYEYKTVETSYRAYRFWLDAGKILDQIEGDVVYASKPRIGSFGISLLKRLQDTPVILDIDDWETGFKVHNGGELFRLKEIPHLINVNSYYYTRAFEELSRFADEVTVSNSFLQSKFGGNRIPHLRDPSRYNPSEYDSQKLREKFKLPKDDILVLYFGTPHPYKGVEDLIQAVELLGRDDVQALVVGMGSDEYSQYLKNEYGETTVFRGKQPFATIPEWIATADIVAIPQRDTPATRGQLPAKLFDAMAMDKPIIATNVSDIPEIVGEYGSIATPSSPNEISDHILDYLKNYGFQKKTVQGGRERLKNNYSFESRMGQIKKIVKNSSYG